MRRRRARGWQSSSASSSGAGGGCDERDENRRGSEAALKNAETVSAAPAKAAADAKSEKDSIIAAYARRHEVKVKQAAAMSASLEKAREDAKALGARLARAGGGCRGREAAERGRGGGQASKR